ncbi:MAG TPA: histidine kinase dimerization/phospho-acceptor domain-containing protein [Terriglobales bacterium]|nr:histidine kinase dimerization/phospho-acceptor domain-containing protein [Terriglobales bacterium]
MKQKSESAGAPSLDMQRCSALDELLHDLSQPLTSLCCQLEVALRKPRTNDEYRDCLARALEQALTAARLTEQLREMNERLAECATCK